MLIRLLQELDQGFRIAFVDCGNDEGTASRKATTRLLRVHSKSPAPWIDLFESRHEGEEGVDAFSTDNKDVDGQQIHRAGQALVEAAGVGSGDMAFIVNGRVSERPAATDAQSHSLITAPVVQVVGPFQDGEFVGADLQTLLAFETRKRISPVVQAIQTSSIDTSALGG